MDKVENLHSLVLKMSQKLNKQEKTIITHIQGLLKFKLTQQNQEWNKKIALINLKVKTRKRKLTLKNKPVKSFPNIKKQ